MRPNDTGSGPSEDSPGSSHVVTVSIRPEADACRVSNADILRYGFGAVCGVSTIGLVILTAIEKGLGSTNDLRVGKAVSINKNVRTPASFYFLLGVTKKRRSGVRDINQETASCL